MAAQFAQEKFCAGIARIIGQGRGGEDRFAVRLGGKGQIELIKVP